MAPWVSYVLQLFSETHKIVNNSRTTKAKNKISTDLESLEYVRLNFRTVKFYLIKFYLLGERASLWEIPSAGLLSILVRLKQHNKV